MSPSELRHRISVLQSVGAPQRASPGVGSGQTTRSNEVRSLGVQSGACCWCVHLSKVNDAPTRHETTRSEQGLAQGAAIGAVATISSCQIFLGTPGSGSDSRPIGGQRWAAGTVASSRRASAPLLSSGSLPLPHFGDTTHEGHPPAQPHERNRSHVACRWRTATP